MKGMSGAVSTCNARAIFNIRCVNIWWHEHMNVISKAARFTSILFRDTHQTLRSIRKNSYLCPNPFKWFTLWNERFEGLTASWSALLSHHPVPTQRCRHHGKNLCKESRGPKVYISCTLRNPSFRRALWSGRFEHFGLERPFNMIEWPQWQYDPWLFSLRSALQRAIYLVWNTPRFTTTHQNKSLD